MLSPNLGDFCHSWLCFFFQKWWWGQMWPKGHELRLTWVMEWIWPKFHKPVVTCVTASVVKAHLKGPKKMQIWPISGVCATQFRQPHSPLVSAVVQAQTWAEKNCTDFLLSETVLLMRCFLFFPFIFNVEVSATTWCQWLEIQPTHLQAVNKQFHLKCFVGVRYRELMDTLQPV